MPSNPLNRLAALGQSVWLDYIHRDLFSSGQLRTLIAQDSLTGMTSNPAIFEKAIADSAAYDEQIKALNSAGKDANAMYEAISLQDVQRAADELAAKKPGIASENQTKAADAGMAQIKLGMMQGTDPAKYDSLIDQTVAPKNAALAFRRASVSA